MNVARSYCYYRPKKDDSEVESAIRTCVETGSCTDGFWKIFQRLRSDGHPWNHKRVYRVYKKMHYNKRQRVRKRLPARGKRPLETPDSPNTTWSMDFVTDVLQSRRKFRVLNVIDDHNRAAVGQRAAMSIPAERVIEFLEEMIWAHGKPKNIRCDNGPEFISHVFQEWCRANEINIKYTQPGCPTQNSYIERFNGSYRRAVLDAYVFRTLEEVREQTEKWMNYYNNERPHEALGNQAPLKYVLQKLA